MRTVPMNLLFDDIEVIESVGDLSSVEVGGISHDSRRVVPGDLFCCVPGLLADGHAYAGEAVERGAVGLLCEHFIPELLDDGVVQTRIAAGTMRPVMARLAAAFYGYPASDLLMIGVTGTNGKTTVTQILGDLLGATGQPTNVMGTLSGARTTPEATEVQRVLAGVRDRQKSDGARHAVAMEVSSHALVQSRVEGIHFDVAVFTNLSHDHLDYHGTMEEYFEAKSLFHPEPCAARRRRRRRPLGPSAPGSSPDSGGRRPPWRRDGRRARPGRTAFTWRGQRVTTPLTGAVNVDNTLLAAEAALALEELQLDPEEIARAMRSVAPVPGRLQVIATPGGVGRRGWRRAALHRGRGLRPHAGRPRGRARRGAEPGAGWPGAHRVRLRRQPRPGQASADGRGGRRGERPGRRDVGQPARRGPVAIIEEVLGGIPGGRDNPRW